MKTVIYFFQFLILSPGLLVFSPRGMSAELYFIDAHSQAEEAIDRDEILARMDDAGVSKTILSARRRRRAFDVADWAEAYPDRLIASVRVKSKHYVRHTARFQKKINKQINSQRFGAMSELLLYHAQKGELAPEVIVYPEDERVTILLDAARQQGWPLVMHIEFAAMHGDMRNKFYTQMEALFTNNPDQPFALIHMGQLDVNAVASLLKKHSNLYFITSHSNTIAVKRSGQPWVNMFQGENLTPAWSALIIKYPQRFIFGVDNVWAEQWRNDYKEQLALWRHALQVLPDDVAQLLAHGNAERLWHIEH